MPVRLGNGSVKLWWNDAQVKETVSKNLTGSQAAPQRCCSKVPIALERLYDIEITWK